MSNRVFKCAVIGLGFISPAHIESYLNDPRAELTAVCDSDEKWLAFAKEKYGAKYAYSDYHELLKNPEIEVVSICLPNRFHAEATIAALEAGKHVLCEKPMAMNVAEAQRMIDAEKRSGKKLMIGQNQRFIPAAQVMRKMFENGEFGEVYHIRTGWRRPIGMMPSPEDTRCSGQITDRNWYNDRALCGGVLRDLGVHMIDLAMYITGFPKVTDVLAAGYRKFDPDVPEEIKKKYSFTSEDMVSGLIKFENGMSLNLEVSFGSAISHEAVYTNVYGTKAGAERSFDDLNIINLSPSSFTVTPADMSGTKPFYHCTNEFLRALDEGSEIPVRAEQCIRVIEILDKLYETSGI